MKTRKARWLGYGLFVGLGLGVVALLWPEPVQAGGLRITIGIPAPVYVAPPVLAYPAPIVVQPPPHIVYPPPVVYSVPYGVYGRHYPPGLAKRFYGHHHHAHAYKFYKHGKHHRKHHHDDD
jgi:hypothetical protein